VTAVDRTPKPCLHKRVNHQHGTRLAYILDRCRCLPCAAANSTYELRRTRLKAYGRGTPSGWVDAAPVRAHVEQLCATGMGYKTVARTANRARREGWAPPAAWDDDAIDDPAAVPFVVDVDEDQVDELAVEQLLDGHRMELTGATLHAAVHALAARGLQPASISERLGIDLRQAQRLRDRAEPPRRRRRSEAA
jgi:hypothetical protein